MKNSSRRSDQLSLVFIFVFPLLVHLLLPGKLAFLFQGDNIS